MASFITANETVTANAKINGQLSRIGGCGKPTIIGRLLNESAGVNAGRCLAVSGTANLECEEPTTAAMVRGAYGFSCYSPMHEPGDVSDGVPFYANDTMVSLMTDGSMFVDCEGTVVANNPVYVRFTSDGADNTELGKVRGNSDGTLVIDTTANAVEGIYAVVLRNGPVGVGTVETFTYATDGSATTAEIIAGLVALIDASANYSAAGTTEITVTLVAGTEISIVELRAPTPATQALWTTTDNQKAAALPGAYFTESRSGAGIVEIHFERNGGI